MTLPELCATLKAQYPDAAPSIATLKRASSTGRLDRARRVETEGSRPRYDLEIASAILIPGYQTAGRLTVRVGSTSSSKAGHAVAEALPATTNGGVADATKIDYNLLADLVVERLKAFILSPPTAGEVATATTQRLLGQVPGLQDLHKLLAAVDSLDATRRSLMAKYDQAAQLQATASPEPRQASSGHSFLEQQRIVAALSRIESLLQGLSR